MSEFEEEVAVEEDSLNADLAAAWDAAGFDEGEETDDTPVDDTPAETPSDAPVDTPPIAAEGEAAVAATDQDEDKAPAGLPLEARQEWDKAPPAIKAAIKQREKDYEAGIVKYAKNAKRAEGMDQALAPYQQLFAMNGGPGQTLPGLLQTASLLQMGSAPQKAQTVANLIKQFGVDIRALDNLLVGNDVPPEMQKQTELEQMFNQRLQPIQQQLQTYQQREQQQVQQAQRQTATELQQFAAQNEFYTDVREDMADLMDLAANRGRHLSLQEAYERACAAHPQISKMVAGRLSTQSIQQKRQAASSIHGSPGGDMSAPAHNSITAALNDAWDNVGRT